MLAKQLVQLRKQKQRTYVASSQITAASYTAEAMGETTKTKVANCCLSMNELQSRCIKMTKSLLNCKGS